MRNSIFRGALVSILLLGLALPGAALAGGGEKGCSNLGTWFGVAPFPYYPTPQPVEVDETLPWQNLYLTGWSVTVTGKSNNEGTNLFEYPDFDATLGIFDNAVRIGSMRGNWKRTGGNTFDYTFMGFAYDINNKPVYIAKISGEVELLADCQYQKTTAVMEVFMPYMTPFQDAPRADLVISLGEFYGYRAKVVPPAPVTFP